MCGSPKAVDKNKKIFTSNLHRPNRNLFGSYHQRQRISRKRSPSRNTANWIASVGPHLHRHWRRKTESEQTVLNGVAATQIQGYTHTLLTFCSPRDNFQFKLPELRPLRSFSVTSLGVINSTSSIIDRLFKYVHRTGDSLTLRLLRNRVIVWSKSFSLHFVRFERISLCVFTYRQLTSWTSSAERKMSIQTLLVRQFQVEYTSRKCDNIINISLPSMLIH